MIYKFRNQPGIFKKCEVVIPLGFLEETHFYLFYTIAKLFYIWLPCMCIYKDISN